MGKELLCQIAVLEQQAGGISEELSNLRAQCLREAADAAFAEYSCTVVEQLEAFSPQLAIGDSVSVAQPVGPSLARCPFLAPTSKRGRRY